MTIQFMDVAIQIMPLNFTTVGTFVRKLASENPSRVWVPQHEK